MTDPSARYVDRSSSVYRRRLAERRLQEVLDSPEMLVAVSKTWDAIERGDVGEPADWDRLRKSLDLD